MGSMDDFLLDANKLKEGVRVPLRNKDGGISNDYIMVRWEWGDEVRASIDKLKRILADKFTQVKPGLDAKKRKQILAKNKTFADESVLNCRVALVASWSFTQKPTKANVLKFLKLRPDIGERIDIAAANTKLFFPTGGENL